MAQTIKLKRSAVQGVVPTTSQLELGEVAINTYDGKMYIKKNVGGTETIVEVGSTATFLPAGSDGQLQFNNGGALGATAQAYYDDVNNRLGIGTSTPVSTLHVDGTTTLSSNLNFLSPDSTNTISVSMLDTDTLSFSGDSGQLFSITDSLSGTIFAVNDISGVPSIEVDDDGTIRFAETFGNVLIGTAVDDGVHKLQVDGVAAVDGVQFDTTAGLTPTVGQLSWNAAAGTLDLGINNDVTLQVGQETHVHVKAAEAISDGDVVYASGAVGNSGQIEVSKFIASTSFDPNRVLGIATQNIAVGEFGYITTFGSVRGISTDGSALTTPEVWVDGTILYASPNVAGELTSTLPEAPNPKIALAFVTSAHATNGSIAVRAYDLGVHMHDVHDVHITSVADNDIIAWNSTNSRWENTDIPTLVDDRYVNVTGDSMTGNLSISSGDDADQLRIVRTSPSSNQVGMSFAVDGQFERWFGVSGSGEPYWATSANLAAGNKIWHEGNFTPSDYLLVSNYVDDYVSSAAFNTSNGVLTLTRNQGGTVTVDLDGRYYNTADSDSRYVNVTGDTMTGTLTVPNLTLSNPGLGNTSIINFAKTSDTAQIRVTEWSSDATEFQFYMADNPSSTSDKFNWYMNSWQGAGSAWKPLEFSGYDTTINSVDTIFNGNLYIGNTPYISTGGVKNQILESKSGTLSLSANVSGFTGSKVHVYIELTTDGTTFTAYNRKSTSGRTAYVTDVAITGGAQAITQGITVTFSGTTGGVAGDNWEFGVWGAGKVNVSTEIAFADNAKAVFGAGDDLQIYHDGSNSWISEVGTGSLIIAADNYYLRNAAGTETKISAISDGSVSLYDNNSVKLATTSSGINVTGNISIDSITALQHSGNFLYLNSSNQFSSGVWFGGSSATFGSGDIGVGSNGTASTSRVFINGGTYDGTTVITIDGATGDITASGELSSGNITTSGYLRGPATFTIDPAAYGDNTGTVVIAGNLQVDGTTTTINSTTVQVDDKNIELAVGSTNKAAADGAGITVDCGTDTDATIIYDGVADKWELNKRLVLNPGDAGAITPNASHDDLIIEGSANTGINIFSPNTSYQYLTFGDNQSSNSGYVRYQHSIDQMVLRAGGTDTVYIDNGQVGIGISSQAGKLHVVAAGGDQTASPDSPTLPDTSTLAAVVIDGNYTDGKYRTRFAKIDRSGNLPLYIQESRGTADSYTNVARFGSFGQSDHEFQVFGSMRADYVSTGGGTVISLDNESWTYRPHDIVYNGWRASTGDYTYIKAAGNSNDNHGIAVVADNAFFVGVTNNETGAIADNAENPITTTWAKISADGIQTNGNINVNSTFALNGEEATLATTTQTQIASFSATTYGGGKFVITAKDGVNRHICELLVTHDGTTAVATQYGSVTTASDLATYDVDISSGSVRILATSASANSTEYKVAETLMEA